MNAHLHLDDDLASYLSEQAQREQTTLDVMPGFAPLKNHLQSLVELLLKTDPREL